MYILRLGLKYVFIMFVRRCVLLVVDLRVANTINSSTHVKTVKVHKFVSMIEYATNVVIVKDWGYVNTIACVQYVKTVKAHKYVSMIECAAGV